MIMVTAVKVIEHDYVYCSMVVRMAGRVSKHDC